MYTRQVENPKGGLGKKGYHGGLKTRKGSSGTIQGCKAYHCIPLDHLVIRPQYQLSSSNETNQSNQLRISSKVMRRSKIQGQQQNWNPMGLLHITVFFLLYTILYSFHFYGGVLLLERQLPCTKRLLQANFENQYKSFYKLCVSFSFLFCFERTSNDLFLTYACEYDCCS